MTDCTIILIAYYGGKWLPNCLASLTAAAAEPLHLVLADNYGNHGLEAQDLRAFRVEVLSLNGPLGFAEANNYTLAKAQQLEEIILFLNQDTISPVGWIDACLECLRQNPQLAAVSPLIRNYEDTAWDPSFLDCLSADQRRVLDTDELPELLLTRNAPAPALLVRRKVMQKVGPFDPIYGSYYEDYDLCTRMRAAGYQIGFCTQARIQHYSGSATDTPEKEKIRMRQIIRNQAIYKIRHHASSRLGGFVHLLVGDFPRRLVRSMIGTPSSQPTKVVLKAYNDLFQLLPRLLSQKKDEAVFQRYLQNIGWNKMLAK